MSLDEKERVNNAESEASGNEPEMASSDPQVAESQNPNADEESMPEMDEFDSLIDSYLDNIVQHELDSVIKVSVVKITDDSVLVDMGDKAEGVIAIHEFLDSKGMARVSEGDMIDVQVMGRDDESGLVEVSYRRAQTHVALERLAQAYKSQVPIEGRVSRKVKGGLLVDVGVECFMPASQVADHRVDKLDDWLDRDIEALVIELDERKRRAVLSRRKLVEEKKRAELEEALNNISEGQVVTGKVKSVLNFGAFIDLDGVDAFLPREEISWDRGMQPNAILKEGDEAEIKILQIDKETGRVRASRKALREDPWETVAQKYPPESTVKGEVVAVTRYGAFVRIEEGLTGLIHVSDLSWAKGPQKVTDHVKEGDMVEAVVLAIDLNKRRLSLGLKQLMEDPWEEADKLYPKGSKVKGTVSNLAPFGAFVKLTDDIEGLVHISDLDWEKDVKHPGEVLKAGDEVEAVVLKSDRQTRRISLGIKQLTESPTQKFLREHPVGSDIEAEVVRMIPTGAFLQLTPKLDGFLHVSQIDIDRVEKPEDAFKVGDKVRCRITKVDKNRSGYRISLSRKAILESEQRKAMREYQADPKDKGVMKLGELFNGLDLDGVVSDDKKE
ncbi:MAG: S1 RNA-binding domain-containing protein [Candidatus Sumerlaeia bacterium]